MAHVPVHLFTVEATNTDPGVGNYGYTDFWLSDSGPNGDRRRWTVTMDHSGGWYGYFGRQIAEDRIELNDDDVWSSIPLPDDFVRQLVMWLELSGLT